MSNLPSQLTLFVGRVEEISELHQLLANPDCRLLTIVGVGGIGKTRLALQAAGQLGDMFADGIFFVGFQPTTSQQFFIPIIADVIGCTLAGNEEPQWQLFTYLANKELLLIIDNFEHMLESAPLLIDLLEVAPHLKLVVTTREPLNLQEEWLYPIQGLAYPKISTALSASHQVKVAALGQYSAVQLFGERARRMRRGFSLEAEASDIATICQLVEGMPLALELAAAWTHSLSCRTIADEIRHNLDFLTSERRNIPERQRSVRAVFAHAYTFLSPAEQKVLQGLSVFRGPFDRRAAEFVAGASLVSLGALVRHSLLRWEPAGYYQMHELLRQYGEELVRAVPEEKTALDERHCLYYMEFLSEHLTDLLGGRQVEAMHAIENSLDNIRVAWLFAVESRKIEAIRNAAHPLSLFYEFRSRQPEGLGLFELAIRELGVMESSEPKVMLLLTSFQELPWYYIRLGRFDEAWVVQKRMQQLYEQLGSAALHSYGGDPALIACMLAVIGGDYEQAIRYGQEALTHTFGDGQYAESRYALENRKYTFYALAGANLAQGNYHVAQHNVEAAHALARRFQDKWFAAYCLVEMANVASAIHDYAAARGYLEESFNIRQEFNDPEGMAMALAFLGEIALRHERYGEAQSYYERSIVLYREINDQGGLARSLDGLANLLSATGAFEEARRQLSRALEIAQKIRFVTLLSTIVTSIGDFLVRTGNSASGLALLAQVSQHPSSTTTCKERASELLLHYRESVDGSLYEAVTSQDQIVNIETLAAMAQVELSAPKAKAPAVKESELSLTPASPLRSQSIQPLLEPLTAREVEILHLVADGLSNQEIATSLFITRGTVKWYTSQIYSKLGIESRTQAIVRARELSIIP